jgi:hypothetical protein
MAFFKCPFWRQLSKAFCLVTLLSEAEATIIERMQHCENGEATSTSRSSSEERKPRLAN